MAEKDGKRKRAKRQSSPPDLLRLPLGLESPDPVDGNPFPVDDPCHRVWEKATIRAEQEVHQVNAAYLKLRNSPQPDSPDEIRRLVLDCYAYLVTAKFDIWAGRGIQVVWGDAAISGFDQWLADYANSWLNSMKSHLPAGTETDWLLSELRLQLIERVEFWKSEVRRYVAEQKAQVDGATADETAAAEQSPVPSLRTKRKARQRPNKRKQKRLGFKSRRNLNYRSPLRAAILLVLSKHPRANNLEICQFLDDEGTVEVPAAWKTGNEERNSFRSFELVYKGPDRHKLESLITKVRNDMRNRGLLGAGL